MSNAAVKPSRLATLGIVLLRLVVGGVFAFSGFVKAVDPYGGYYKIIDYLNALGLESLLGLALFGAITLAAVEFTLGVMVIVGAHRRVAPWLMLLMLLVMTPLTLWLAVTNAVPDCGCFGDAIHISNTATFVKNVFLLAGVIALILYNKRVTGLYSAPIHWVVPVLSIALSLAVSLVGYFIQPGIDFRPYPVGTHVVPTGMEAADQDYRFVYEKDGERHEFTIDSLPDEEQGWTFVERQVVAQPTTASPDAREFTLRDIKTMADVSATVLTDTTDVVLLLFPNIATISAAHTYPLNRLTDRARAAGYVVAGVTGASEREIEQWGDISMADYEMYRADDSDVKMLARGNPAVVFLHQGIVEWKTTLTWIETINEDLEPMALPQWAELTDTGSVIVWLFYVWLALMLIMLALNRIPLWLAHRLARRDK